jgi:hypothetical protein
MNDDELERMRKDVLVEVNENKAKDRADAESKFGTVWNTEELQQDFDILGFLAPFVVVYRKSDGKKGSLVFQHSPRFYHTWKED